MFLARAEHIKDRTGERPKRLATEYNDIESFSEMFSTSNLTVSLLAKHRSVHGQMVNLSIIPS